MNNTEKLSTLARNFAPAVIRWSMAAVFIWFGWQQVVDTQTWVGWMPDYIVALTHLSATTLVHINGVFEIFFGIALALGFNTRLVALVLALHFFDITYIVGYNAIGVRDFGLAMATFAIFLYGRDMLSLDFIFEQNEKSEIKSVPPQSPVPPTSY